MKAIAAVCLLWALPTFAAPPIAPIEPLATTRAGYKARNDRQRWHEANLYPRSLYGTAGPIPRGGSAATIIDYVSQPRSQQETLWQLGSSADLVAIMTVYNARPVLSQREDFIFTEYKVETNEVIKGTLRVGDRTTVTRAGGTIVLPDEKITFDADRPLVVGSTYLMFLRHLPATNDYTEMSHEALLEIRPGGRMQSLYGGSAPIPRAEAQAILDLARAQGAR